MAALQLSSFQWAVYSFNSGHFISSIKLRSLPFTIALACDPSAIGRSLFHDMTKCQHVMPSAASLLDHIRSSGIRTTIDGYLIHSHRFTEQSQSKQFWSLQHSIIANLRVIRSLKLFVAHIHPDQDERVIQSFQTSCKREGWVITSTPISFAALGDSITGSCRIIIGVHRSTAAKVDPLTLMMPPTITPPPRNSRRRSFVYQRQVLSPSTRTRHVNHRRIICSFMVQSMPCL